MPCHRPRGFDFGHFRPTRPHARGQVASGIGAAHPLVQPLGARLCAFAKPKRRHRHERPRGNPAGNRPPLNRQQNHPPQARIAAGEKTAPNPAQKPLPQWHAHFCFGWLHQCRQIQRVQPFDQGRSVGQRPIVCHARHHRAPLVFGARSERGHHRYRRFCARFAA